MTVSLGSEQCVLFKRRGCLARCVRLPVGSALRLDGCAANDWTHGLPPATSPRVSLTFRRLNAETKSKFAAEARRVQERRDAKKELKRQQRNKPPKPSVRAERRPEAASLTTEASEKTPSIELEHVRGVYNAIAPQWHGTRYKAWPRVAKFCLMNVGRALVADVGCGNGKMALTRRPTVLRRLHAIDCVVSGSAVGGAFSILRPFRPSRGRCSAHAWPPRRRRRDARRVDVVFMITRESVNVQGRGRRRPAQADAACRRGVVP